MKAARKAGTVKKPRSLAVKAGLQFPMQRIFKKLKMGNYAVSIRKGAAVYLAAILEYLGAEILELLLTTSLAGMTDLLPSQCFFVRLCGTKHILALYLFQMMVNSCLQFPGLPDKAKGLVPLIFR